MYLIIFDIDGTIIKTHQQEAACFAKALAEVTGIHGISLDLLTYKHVTDHGIAQECIFNHLNRAASDQELTAIDTAFLTHFEAAIKTEVIEPIHGIPQFIHRLNQEHDIYLSIATGSSLRAAQMKLAQTQVQFNIPIATSNDHFERVEIMRTAKEKAQAHYQKKFEHVAYIGDGPWDVKAAKSLNWQLLGISSNYSKETLMEVGAKKVIENYEHDHDELIRYLKQQAI